MRFLRQNTAVRITVGPFLDHADGLTPLNAITTVADIVGAINYDDDDGTATHAIHFHPAASGSDNDMVAVGADGAGLWDLELTQANTNYVGRMILSLTDAAQICPVFHEFMVLPAATYDALVTNAAGTANGLLLSGANNKALVSTCDTVTAATLANGAHGGAAATITLQTPIAASGNWNVGKTGYTAAPTAGSIVTASFGTCVLPETTKTALLPAVAAGAVSGLPINNADGVVDSNVEYVADSPASVETTFNANVTQWLGTAVHAATVAGVPVVQLHNSAGTGGINAPANFEDMAITDTTGKVSATVATNDGVDAAAILPLVQALTNTDSSPLGVDITGTLSPDATGHYSPSSIYGLLPAFKLRTGTWYLWYSTGPGLWAISEVIGTLGARYWLSASSNKIGGYTAYGTATGAATVANTLTQTDMKKIVTQTVTAAAGVTFPASVGDATAANQTTILARLGSWTGSGINTILGAFRALVGKKAALTPTDLTADSVTYDNTTDSLEALQEYAVASRVATNYSGAFTGAVLANAPTGATASYTVSSTTVGAASEVNITQYRYAMFGPVAITASAAQTGDSHSFLVYKAGATGTVLWSLTTAGGEISVGGVGDKTITLTDTDAHTGTPGKYPYVLRNTTDDTVVCVGYLTIVDVPNVPST